MTIETGPSIALPDRPLGRLKAKRGPLPWLLRWQGEVPDALRPALLGALLSSPGSAVMAVFNGMLVAGLAYFATRSPVFAVMAIGQIILLGARIASLRHTQAALARGAIASVDTPTILSIIWCTTQGVLSYFALQTNQPAIMVIAVAQCMGLAGPLCARHYAAPRLAIFLVALCIMPMLAGALTTGDPMMLILLALWPGFLLGAIKLITSYRHAMLASLNAELDNAERARHDPLTGLLNRHGLEGVFASLSPDDVFSLVCFDLDEFKPVNDRFGHAAGDRMLREVTERMQAALGGGDFLARIGGDEFLALLQGKGPDAAKAVIDTVLRCVAGKSYAVEGKTLVEIGITAGFACYPEDSANIAELQTLADRALYAAKQSGKGFGTRYTPLLAA